MVADLKAEGEWSVCLCIEGERGKGNGWCVCVFRE
jgi:hypothetical protein